MSNNLPLYNVNDYTDVELYNILDLVNPTDRELEAKILMQVHKYENIGTKSAQKLARFFDDIYNHFFETEEEEEAEEEEEEEEALEGYANQDETDKDPSGARQVNRQPKSAIDANIAAANNALDSTKNNAGSTSNMVSMAEKSAPETTTVGYTQNLDYTKGKLNPILQQTTKRVISIDSQYRSDKRTMSTAFTFNLSEPLKDVVSLKLYSIQIPYTWYTIGKAYGNNFFFFKGRTAGIDTDYHDLKIEIDPGNYSPKDLIETVNGSITTLKASAIDISMGLTAFSYNKFTSICTLYANLSKSYNESSYYIEFPAWSSPYLTNNPIETIPSFLGLQTDKYYSNTLKSFSYYNLIDASNNDVSGNDSAKSFIVNANNNYFTIELYKETYTNVVDNSFNITLTNGTYTRKQLIAHVNTLLTNNSRLVNSGLVRKNIDSRNDIANDASSKKSYIELTVNLNRILKNNIVNENPKIRVVFPDVSTDETTNLWVNTPDGGDNSCFGFYTRFNHMDDIIGELSPAYQSYSYPITTSPYILMKSNISYFNNGLNDISFNITNSPDVNGYNLKQYIDEINASIRRFDASNRKGDPSYNICNSPQDTSYNFVPTIQNPYPIGTYAYMDNDYKFNLYLDINKTYDERYYEIELAGGVFDSQNGIFKFKDQYGVAYTKLTDLTKTYTSIYTAAGIVIDINQLIFKIKPKNSGSIVNGNENDVTYELRFPNTTTVNYSGYIEFKNALHAIFTNYKDPISNVAIFENLRFTETIGSNSYVISFNPKINKKLIAKNYNIQFVDPSVDVRRTNSWSDNLNIFRSMANSISNATPPYDMSYNLPLTGQYTTLYDNSSNIIFSMDSIGKVNIRGYAALAIDKTITINPGVNDTINIVAYEEGVYTATAKNNVSISIGPGTYSRDTLINTINRAFQTVVSTTTKCANTVFDITPINNATFLKMNLNITRNYTTADFDVVFFDNESFATCTSGASSVQNTTWDTTVGWIMGFREFTLYDMSAPDVITTNISNVVSIMGDTGLSTNLYNYFLICLDDFNQNRLNDGLVTITNVDTSIPLPSYASRSDFVCDPSGQKVYSAAGGLTEKQIYAAQAIANSGTSTESIGSSVSTKSYGSGPFVTDVFGLIPMKVSGLENGSTYVEFGGTLQNQQRNYFGPVNIHRMSVRLVTDRGNLVDLNKANWSFSLVCEQLNKLDPTSSK